MIIPVTDMLAFMFFVLAFFPHMPVFFFVLAVLIHEAGHLLCSKILAVKLKKIEYETLRAIIETEEEGMYEKFLILIWGPLSNLISSAFVFCFFKDQTIIFPYISFFLAVINLLPISKLDGGQIAEIVLLKLFSEKGRTIAAVLSDVCIISVFLFSSFRMLKYGDSFTAFFFAFSCLFNSRKNEETSVKHTHSKAFERKS